jgi:MFS family permease
MPEQQGLSKDARMAMLSQFLGFMLDAYDMALVLVMAPILVKIFVSPKASAAWQYIVIVFTYSITMAARPIGSAIFGRYADKIGRQFLFLTDYSVYGFLPNILTLKGRGFDTTTYSLIYGFALFMAFLGYNFYGWLSDRTGRKILTQWYCGFLVVLGFRCSTFCITPHSRATYGWQSSAP